MKCSQRFLTLRVYSATSVSWSTWYLLIHLTELSYYLRLVSLMSLRWENYSQVSPWKVFKNFSFSSVSQAVSTGVLRQGVFKVSHASRMTFISRFHNLSLCFFKETIKDSLGASRIQSKQENTQKTFGI